MSITVKHSSKASLTVEIEDDALFDLLLNHRNKARSADLSENEETVAEKLTDCKDLTETLNKRLEKMNDRIESQLQIETPVGSERNCEPYRTPSPVKFMVPRLKPIRSSSVPGSYLRFQNIQKTEIMPDNDYYEEDPSNLTSELTTLSSLSGRGGSLSDISRVSVKDLCRRFEI